MVCQVRFDVIRDAPAGTLIRALFGPAALPYAEELPDFVLPESLKACPCFDEVRESAGDGDKRQDGGQEEECSDNKALVTWYGDDDQDNPLNWSTSKKIFVQTQICFFTFAVYSSTSIITPAESYFREQWGATEQTGVLVLSMFMLGIGMGPLIFSPMSEVPRLGRNIPYLTSLSLFLCMTIAAATVKNYPGLVVIRFLQGLLGGPVLATGGASAGDVFPLTKLPYALAAWGLFAFGGPGVGPLLSGFAVQESTWRWSMYESLILSGVCWILLVLFFPETNPETILLHRANRLRAVTGCGNLHSQSEIKQRDIHLLSLMGQYLTVPFRITILDPSVAFINLYTAFLYGFFYSFFESFPLVFVETYHFNIGEFGLAFISLVIGSTIALFIYVMLVYFIYEPYTCKNGIGVPEYRLTPGIVASATAPIGVFIFAWTARPDISWAMPLVGTLLLSGSCAVLYMLIFLYLPLSYPRYAASLFAANTFIRSSFTTAAIHFSNPLFRNLGIGRGNSILGGLLVGCFFAFVLLWRYGPTLRARSQFTAKY